VTEVDLLVLGDANPDLVLRGGDVVPAFGQVEHIVDEARFVIGGSGAIVAAGAARLGLRVAFVGVVGDDMFGEFIRRELQERGVDVRGLVVDSTRATGVTVVLSADQDRAMLTVMGTIGDLRRDLIDPDIVAGVKHIHVSSYFLQRSIAPDLPDLFDAAHTAGATTSVDPNWDPSEQWDGGLPAVLDRTDVFLPNAVEAMCIARAPDVDQAVRALSKRARIIVVKAGDRGALAGDATGVILTEPLPVRPVDTTGAGDSFDAGFLYMWLDGAPLERALEFANACGALSTLAVGGTQAQPTTGEVVAAIRRGSAA